MNEKKQIIYTKERKNQTQLGELSDIFIQSYHPISNEYLIKALISKIKRNKNVFALIDLSQDDIGSRANYGKGHSKSLYPFKPFLEKFSNHPLNRFNQEYIRSLLLVVLLSYQI